MKKPLITISLGITKILAKKKNNDRNTLNLNF